MEDSRGSLMEEDSFVVKVTSSQKDIGGKVCVQLDETGVKGSWDVKKRARVSSLGTSFCYFEFENEENLDSGRAVREEWVRLVGLPLNDSSRTCSKGSLESSATDLFKGLRCFTDLWDQDENFRNQTSTYEVKEIILFLSSTQQWKVMALIVYVVATEDDLEEIEWLKERLATEFDIKDLGG
ncbi:hypothetical protein CK203_110424 [Vitis vinifera]|uniref:Uncharacterized protein n=1 Tax=Vitis vinifera TaxID=29760 RepID=A0A438CA67_VITVI|nr:hypothetical protein CK203_110424 [Vitis vinifera]